MKLTKEKLQQIINEEFINYFESLSSEELQQLLDEGAARWLKRGARKFALPMAMAGAMGGALGAPATAHAGGTGKGPATYRSTTTAYPGGARETFGQSFASQADEEAHGKWRQALSQGDPMKVVQGRTTHGVASGGAETSFQSGPKGKSQSDAKGINKFDGVTHYGGSDPKIIAALKKAGFKRDSKTGKYVSPKYQTTTSFSQGGR